MTDKQIIIDGHDVSGCRFYSEKLSTMNGTGSISVTKCNGFCTHNIRGLDDSSCYDAHIEYAKCKNNNCYYKQLKRKEQECEELKAENDTYKSSIIANLDKSISKRYRELLEENDQLKQTLEEIREIAEKTLTIVDYKTYFARDNKSFKQEAFKALKQIQEKINEVNNELL